MTKLVLFGITGDLSRRKLLPALSNIVAEGKTDLEIIGVSRREVDIAALLDEAHASELTNSTCVFTMDLSSSEDYLKLKQELNLKDEDNIVVYLSVPPEAALEIVEFLGKAGLNGANIKLMIEKPFGSDFNSAKAFLDSMAQFYNEGQIYRIDHYLAKKMAQDLVAARLGNNWLEDIWNNKFIEKIEIFALEEIGIEGRATFYEQTGALRDLIQSHLLELLAITLMDLPADSSLEDIPKLRANALKQIQIANPAKAFRAQYDTYKEEVGTDKSFVETFASIELSSSAARWRNVPVILTTGKGLDKKSTQIHLSLQGGDKIIVRIQPNEGVDIPASLSNNLEPIISPTLFVDAYEQVLRAAINGQKNLFVRSDEVLQSWKILAPIQESWAKNSTGLKIYKKGSSMDSISRT